MDRERLFAISPVQLATVLADRSLTEAEALSNRLLGGLELAEHEGIRNIGGHTLKKHIAKTDEELLARLAQSPGLPAATSFENVQQAEKYISAGLRAKRLEIVRWANTARRKEALVITWHAGTKVGYGFRQGSKIKWPVNHVRIVLVYKEYRDKPYYIVSAYPELL